MGRIAFVLTLVTLVAGGALAYLAILAFNTPVLGGDQGAVEIGMQGTGFVPTVNASVSEYENGSHTATAYTVLFPSGALGQKWIVVLGGAAVLKHPVITDDQHRPLQAQDISTKPCTRSALDKPSVASTCQVFTGTVESSGSQQQYFDGCYGNYVAADAQPSFATSAKTVGIEGASDAISDINWAYKRAVLPDLHGEGLPHRYFGLDVASGFVQASVDRACSIVGVPAGYTAKDADPVPAFSQGLNVEWLPMPFQVPSATFRKRSADALQNGGIVGAGVLFTIAGGFLPVWFQNWYGFDHTSWIRRTWRQSHDTVKRK